MRPCLQQIIPIVEGHGEVEAVRILLKRLGREFLNTEFHVHRPIRRPRSKLVQADELRRAVDLADLKLKGTRSTFGSGLILILLDADADLPCELGPRLLQMAFRERDPQLSCVVANVEYETWFVAAASSLPKFLNLPDAVPSDPEGLRQGKGWIKRYFNGAKYSEVVDQPRLTYAMDLHLCRQRSPSFDKLCRDLQRFV